MTEYFDLVAASKVLDALKTVWKSTEDWETMYTRYVLKPGLWTMTSQGYAVGPKTKGIKKTLD